MRRALLVLLALSFLGLSGCATRGISHVDGRIEVRFWHSMGGANLEAAERMVNGFNESQDKYQVVHIYQGDYAQSLKKLVSSFGTSAMPTMIQLDDIEVQFMIDSRAVTPVQKFIDREQQGADVAHGYPPPFDLSDFEPRALAYYTVDGILYSMPFNLAGPILYYNKGVFEDAGLDPNRPPTTFDEVREYSEKVLVKKPDGSIERNGIALAISTWHFEQMLAKQGALYANNGNGREGRATGVAFDSPEGREILSWWQEMVRSGLATNVGRDSLQALVSVLSGKSAMTIGSTGSIRAVLVAIGPENAARFGAGPLPAPYSSEGGIVLGGASVWIMSDRPEAEQEGAWEFLKYATRPDIQAQWHFDTGYFPVRVSAWDMEPAASLHKDFPQFTVARNQLLESPINSITDGAVIGPFTQVRDTIEEAFEQVLVGGKTPEEALESAREEADRAIERYNRSIE